MKFLKQFLIMTVVMIGLSMTATAQRDNGNQNRPPKNPDNQPKIEPKEKPKPERPPERPPKKPQEAIFVSRNRDEISFV
jgi:outer membrane biosynthesis protein TonB